MNAGSLGAKGDTMARACCSSGRHQTGHGARWRARRNAAPVLVLWTVAAVLLTGCAGTAATPTTATGSGGYHGPEPDRAPPRPSFVLRDLSGKVFDFERETRGHPTYLYFGYTNCPDHCPTAMADLATVLRRTDPELREQVKVVLVGTDPDRDTPTAMKRFLAQFSTDFIGLVGTQADIEAAQRAAGVRPAERQGQIPTLPGKPNEHAHRPGTAPHKHFGPLGYGVGHTDVILAYNSTDTMPVRYPGGTIPADIAADLPRLADPGSG